MVDETGVSEKNNLCPRQTLTLIPKQSIQRWWRNLECLKKNSLCPRQDSFTYIKTVSSKMVEETGVPNEIITIQMI